MSNETPKPSHAKTKSARKLRYFSLLAIIFVAFLSAVALSIFYGRNKATLQFGSRQLIYETVANTAGREKGLSGRASMPADHGMLFMFEQEGRHCFWMKDMRFDLDMVWLDATGTVVTIRDRISPATYPAEFCPDRPAKYVIEVNAGTAAAAGVTVDSRISIP